MDIIEIILSSYTDFIKFEDLANEIMIQEGYNNLIPAGGWHDDGVDARLVKYYEQPEYKIIFQYSMQENTKSKIASTYKKLKKKGKECDELIIVTIERINNKEEVKKVFRKEFGLKPRLEIYDRQTFKSRLGTNSAMLNRYFPNIKEQLESDLFGSHSSDERNDKLHEKSLVKISIALSQTDLSSESNKKNFDSIVEFFVYSNTMSSIEELHGLICHSLQADIQQTRVESSIKRLIKQNRLKEKNQNYVLAPEESLCIEESFNKLISEQNSLFDDIIYKAQSILGRELSPASMQIAKNNIEESLTNYFKVYAIERSLSDDAYDSNDLDLSIDLIEKLKRSLPEEESEVLIYCIGELLRKPSDDQRMILRTWSQTYLGCQVLKLDPKQVKFQRSHLKDKNFVLDTDFTLNLIVSEVDRNAPYQRIVMKLLEYGANIIIPIDILAEVAKHAEYAPRSYKYFLSKSDTLDEIILESQIRNVFTKGYFVGRTKGNISKATAFDVYVKNYYDSEKPIDFLIDLITDTISTDINFVNLTDLSLEDEGYVKLEELKDKIYELTLKTDKAEYRSEYENKEIARIDARLYLDYYYENQKTQKKSNTFKYDYYILTGATRALRCAKEMGIFEQFYIKPLKMVSLLERIEPFELSYEELTNIFTNPYLAYAVTENWEYIEKLLDIGVDLRDANITRLKWVLADLFEKDLFNEQNGLNDEDSTKEGTNDSKVEEFIEISKEISQRGYRFVPSVRQLIEKYEEEHEKNIENNERLNELENEIQKFGKGKKKYLKRIANKIR